MVTFFSVMVIIHLSVGYLGGIVVWRHHYLVLKFELYVFLSIMCLEEQYAKLSLRMAQEYMEKTLISI